MGDPERAEASGRRQVTDIREIHIHLHTPDYTIRFDRLEQLMASEVDAINALSAKVDTLIADVRAALAVVSAGQLSPEGQAAVDSLNAKLDAFGAEVGDANADGTVA